MRRIAGDCWPTPGLRASCRAIAACAVIMISMTGFSAHPVSLGANLERACAALTGQVPATAIGLKSGPAVIDSAAIVPAVPFSVARKGPTPAARIVVAGFLTAGAAPAPMAFRGPWTRWRRSWTIPLCGPSNVGGSLCRKGARQARLLHSDCGGLGDRISGSDAAFQACRVMTGVPPTADYFRGVMIIFGA